MRNPTNFEYSLYNLLSEFPPASSAFEQMCFGEFEGISEDVGNLIWCHVSDAAEAFLGAISTPSSSYITLTDTDNGNIENYIIQVNKQLEAFLAEIDPLMSGKIIDLHRLVALTEQSQLLQDNDITMTSAFIIWCARKLAIENNEINQNTRLSLVAYLFEASQNLAISEFYAQGKIETERTNDKFTEQFDLYAAEMLAKARSEVGRNAADKRHSRPNGAKEKQRTIREIWASGKYETRDDCASGEWKDLNWNYSSARKALRNTSTP